MKRRGIIVAATLVCMVALALGGSAMDIQVAHEWYRYQGESDSNNPSRNSDCGPACVAMAIQFTTQQRISIKDISKVIGHSGTTALSELKKPLKHWGVSYTVLDRLEDVIQAVNQRSHIVICPVRMSAFSYGPDRDGVSSSSVHHFSKYRTYEGGHFLVVKGFSSDGKWVIVYDPLVFGTGAGDARYWYSNGVPKGKNRYYLVSEFRSAIAGWHALEILSTPHCNERKPLLRIDGNIVSQRQQLDTFRFTGSGFTPGARVIQNIRFPDGTVRQSETLLPSGGNGALSWEFTPQCTSPVGRYTIWVTDPQRGDSNYVYETITRNPSCSQTLTPSPQPSPLPTLPPTATILVMDVSGSMGWSWKGGVKIESAKKAALEFIEEVTHEAQTRGGQHKIGVVAFSNNASLLLPLTSDYNRARQVIISLNATNWTNLGAGLTTALAELDTIPNTAQRFVILLSDGETNTGLSRDQILSGPVLEARRKHICIHTVAFGDPGDIDKPFLEKVGYGSGCGSYSYASTPFELFATYIKLRHQSLGQVVGEYSSMGKRVTILPGTPISLGTIIIGSGKRELHYTLAWSEKGRLQIRLKDPSGRLVTSSYPGAYIYTADQFTHLTLLSPKSGIWTVEAAAGSSMPNGTEYYAIISTRPGGLAIPLPLPTFTVGNRTFGLPSGLPPWLLVMISVALIALVLYIKMNGQ